ncbi:MAG: hypothetical protein HMLKMBBP_02476 [Planctomycetes bacterium]|nr:hypothetical protein [Planctomycetota bacterium]
MTEDRERADERDVKQCGRCQAWIPGVATMCAYCGTNDPDKRISSKPLRSPIGLPHGVTVVRAITAVTAVWFVVSVWLQIASGHGGNVAEAVVTGRGLWHGLWFAGVAHAESIRGGEWWRVPSCVFLHVGLIHFAVNMFSLRSLGALGEPLFGGSRFLTIYLASGFASAFGPELWHHVIRGEALAAVPPQAGASGAIFGIGAAMTAFMLKQPTGRARQIGFTLAWNLAMSFAVCFFLPIPISHAGHAAGALVGAAMGLVAKDAFSTRISPESRRNWWAAAATLSVATLVAFGFAFRFAMGAM